MTDVLIIQSDLCLDYDRNNESDVMDYVNCKLRDNNIAPENIIDIKVNTVFVPIMDCDTNYIRYVITVFYKVEE